MGRNKMAANLTGSRWRWLGAGLALWTLAACGTPTAKPKATAPAGDPGVGTFRVEFGGASAGAFKKADVGTRKDVKPDKLVGAFKGVGRVVLYTGSGDGLARWNEAKGAAERKVELIALDSAGNEVQRRTVRVCGSQLQGHQPASDTAGEQARQLILNRCPGD